MTFETDSNIAELNLIDDLLGVRENIISCALLKRTGTSRAMQSKIPLEK